MFSGLNAPTLLISGTLMTVAVTVIHGCDDKQAGSPTRSAESVTTANAAEEYRSLHASTNPQLFADLQRSRGELTSGVQRHLQEAQPVVDRLVWATRLDNCDWGVDYQSAETQLAHLDTMRDLAVLMSVHAQQSARNRDFGAMSENVVAIVRLSRHTTGKAPLEVIMAYFVLEQATNLVLAHAHELDKSQRALIRTELASIDRQDPLGAEEALAWHRSFAQQRGLPQTDEAGFRQRQARIETSLAQATELVD